MALDYDTAVGYTQSSTSSVTKKLWDSLLHKQVQAKLFWKDMIGKDKGGEDSIEADSINYPIVEKTDLRKSRGDNITLQLHKVLVSGDETAAAYLDAGMTGTQQLVDNEAKLSAYYMDVPVDLYRHGFLIQGEMAEQRNPADLQKSGNEALSVHLAKRLDDGIFIAFYGKFSPNVWRGGSKTGVAHPNRIFGKNKAALTDVDANDVLDTDVLERVAVALVVNKIAPVSFEGEASYGLCVHPYGMKTLRADSNWKDAVQLALPRSAKNPIFTRADGQRYAGIYVMEDPRISTEKLWTNAASSNAISTVNAATVGAGMTATDIRMNVVFGSNAIGRAFAKESFIRRRKEDDYGNLIGFGGGYIYGDIRADWTPDGGGTAVNQSSFLLSTYSPNPSSNVSAIWT